MRARLRMRLRARPLGAEGVAAGEQLEGDVPHTMERLESDDRHARRRAVHAGTRTPVFQRRTGKRPGLESLRRYREDEGEGGLRVGIARGNDTWEEGERERPMPKMDLIRGRALACWLR